MFHDNIYMVRVASKMGVSLLWQPATVHCIWRINSSLFLPLSVRHRVSAF